MFELGQPLHAFDAATLRADTIGVSYAADGERLKTLDGIDRVLVATDLMIRDGDRGVALAGVMGGHDTEVTDGTTRVLLEAACFKALLVRKTARRLGLHSEASHRFERGVDAELASLASARAARLFCEVAGGKVAGDLIDAYPNKRVMSTIHVRLPRVRMLSGVALDGASCKDALDRLGFMTAAPDDTLAVTPPSMRADVSRRSTSRIPARTGTSKCVDAARAACRTDRTARRSRGPRSPRARRRRCSGGDHVRLSVGRAVRRARPACDRSPRAADRDPQPDERAAGGDAHVAAPQPDRRDRTQPELRPP
jgi:hypothetical protein